MSKGRHQGSYPTNADFAWRLLACLNKVAGTLSEKEFLGLFSFRSRNRVLARFRRAVFRGYLKMYLIPPKIERLRECSFGAKRRYILKTRSALCGAWRKPYDLYRELIPQGFDREAFYFWWDGLCARERLLFLDACVEKIEQSAYQVWFDGLGENARIHVQLAGGSESGAALQF